MARLPGTLMTLHARLATRNSTPTPKTRIQVYPQGTTEAKDPEEGHRIQTVTHVGLAGLSMQALVA